VVKGESQSRLKEIYKFDLKGNFRCILRDSTYEYESFYQDFLEHQDSLDLVKLKRIAYSNPDSVTELWLKYKHFGIIKGDLVRFRNLQKLGLSDFPSLDGLELPALKQLKELSIDGDSLKQLPGNIDKVENLEILKVMAPIKSVPNLYKMRKLKELDLGATKVYELSDSLVCWEIYKNCIYGLQTLTTFPSKYSI
jgi:Leucine-rich repeat (LRR) protein